MTDKPISRPRMPLVLDPPKRKRGSLDISPIQSSMTSSATSSHLPTPSSSVPSTPQLLSRPVSPPRSPGKHLDSDEFLTAIAAQERRVLEIREELSKAETELGKLKRQWAMHESRKSTSEALQVDHARTPRAAETNSAAHADRRSQHMERKRAESWVRPTQRKVFSGSKHARTLSLLHGREMPTTSSDSKLDRGLSRPSQAVSRPASGDTAPEEPRGGDNVERPSETDMILETGKQLVGDFRSGFWTFFEDLRQVTIGEDVSRDDNATTTPKASSDTPSSLSPSGRVRRTSRASAPKSITEMQTVAVRGSDGTGARTYESGATPEDVAPKKRETVDGDSDGQESLQQMSLQSPGVTASLKSDGSTPRTSVSSIEANPKTTESPPKETEKTWVGLSRLTPSNLTKTASSFMTDWEKSLRPLNDDMRSHEAH